MKKPTEKETLDRTPIVVDKELGRKALRASLVAWLRWYAPSAEDLKKAPDECLLLLDAMAWVSGAQEVAWLATEIENYR